MAHSNGLHPVRKNVYKTVMRKETAKARRMDKRSHSDLISAIEPLARLYEYMPDVYFFAKNIRGEFIFCNRPFVQMVGAGVMADVLGKNDYDFAPADLAARFVRDDQEVMRTGRPIERRIELVPNADGSITWHETSKIALMNRHGRIMGLAGITRDLHSGEASWRRFEDLATVVEHIARHYAEPCRVPELAKLAHRSISQFVRRFKAVFRTTPARYVQKIRLQQACRMLATTPGKIVDIAVSCGFHDHSHFTRNFIGAFGMPPGSYRRRHRGLDRASI